jgi:hypothetical protein
MTNYHRAEAETHAATQQRILAGARARRVAPAPAPQPVTREEQVLRAKFGLDEDELAAWRRGLADYDPADEADEDDEDDSSVPPPESEALWAEARARVSQERVAA